MNADSGSAGSGTGARFAWLCGYAVVTFLSFPHPVGERVVDLGVWLSWLSPALLVLVVADLSPRAAARWGFAASLAAHSAILHWIYVVTVVYGHAPVVVGLLAPVLVAAYIALFGGAFAALYRWLAVRGRASPLAGALIWTVLDHLRSFLFTGFPWATLGYAQHDNQALVGLAAFTGVYGLSMVTALGGVALAEAFAAWRAGAPIPVRVGVAWGLVAALHLLVWALAPAATPADRSTLRVAVVQGNIDQGVKWSSEWGARTLSIYEDLTRRAAGEGARLVVWPETAVPGAIEADEELRRRLADLARETGAALVVGGVGLSVDPLAGARSFHDSAFVLDAAGTFGDRYDKAHLVPFGEYVPLRALLGRFFGAVARGIASADVSAGPGPRGADLRLSGGEQVRVGIPICFELLFPGLVRRFAADGGGLLLAITNDAWYGRTGAPHQFLAMTALRSVETGLWTARAANTGVSAFTDPRGRVHQATPIFERAYRVADLPVHPSPASATFYVRHGDVFAVGCWLGVAALLGGARGRRMSDAPGL